MPETGGFMSKTVRSTLSLGISLVLFSALALAQAGGNAGKDKDKNNQAHHSHLAKAAFWRHHKDTNKNAKPAPISQAGPQKTQAKTAPAQVKPVSAKAATSKNDQKPAQHAGTASASNMSKPSPKKAPAASKTKSQQKAQTQSVSLKQ
jgi:hypothetical protein